MKVDRSDPKIKTPSQATQKDSDKKVNPTANSKFLKFMDMASEEKFEDRMKQLAKDILDQGEKLSKRTDVRELKIYKNLIAEFLGQVVSNSHKFTKQSKMDKEDATRFLLQ